MREGETQDNFQVEVWQLSKLCQLVKQEEVPVWSGCTQAEGYDELGIGAPESSNWDNRLTFGPVDLEEFVATCVFLTTKYRLYGVKSM